MAPRRLCPWDDAIAVTAAQVREVFQRLYVAGQWQIGDPPVLVVVDAGYDVTRLAFLLADLPVELLGRMRSDRVLYFPPAPQPAGKRGRKPKRGAEFAFEVAATQPVPSVTTVTDTTHYGKAVATAWDRLHPLLVRRSAWADHPEGEPPVIEGTVIRLQVDHLRGDRSPKPVWLWWSATAATAGDVDRLWQAFLRRVGLTGPSAPPGPGRTASRAHDPARGCGVRRRFGCGTARPRAGDARARRTLLRPRPSRTRVGGPIVAETGGFRFDWRRRRFRLPRGGVFRGVGPPVPGWRAARGPTALSWPCLGRRGECSRQDSICAHSSGEHASHIAVGPSELQERRCCGATSRMPGGYDPNFVHCPSETTSTEPSTTLMAVCSSMA
ncbi:transposase [Streptomyces mirabilis]